MQTQKSIPERWRLNWKKSATNTRKKDLIIPDCCLHELNMKLKAVPKVLAYSGLCIILIQFIDLRLIGLFGTDHGLIKYGPGESNTMGVHKKGEQEFASMFKSENQAKNGRAMSVEKLSNHGRRLDAYDILRIKWEEHLLQTKYFDASDIRMKKAFDRQMNQAVKWWKELNKNKERTYLWFSSEFDVAKGKDKTSDYNRLLALSKAFCHKLSPLNSNLELLYDIRSALEWLYQNKYHVGIERVGNWWHYERGAPKALVDIAVLLYDHLSEETLIKYMTTVDHFSPSAGEFFRNSTNGPIKSSAANVFTSSAMVILNGALLKRESKIEEARNAIIGVLKHADTANGFHPDGSFIQHNKFAYTGAYGLAAVEPFPFVVGLLTDTRWEIKHSEMEFMFKVIKDSFEPVIYKGLMMDMVRGRSIAKSGTTDQRVGKGFTTTLLRMAEIAPQNYSRAFKRMARYWVLQNPKGYARVHNSFSDYQLYDRLISNDTADSRGSLNLNKVFAIMDRVVHHRQNYAFGISMYSKRIQNFESILGNNLKGWHTGSGMTYLYNNDLSHFNDGFWPTVDPYRLPGTTVGRVGLMDGANQELSSESWVGGVSLNETYGAAGMSLHVVSSGLKAKKSWFMFDEEIVALGANISGEKNNTIETTIENRKLNSSGDNPLIINGQLQNAHIGWEKIIDKVHTVYLQGNTPGSDISFFFPNPQNVHLKKEERVGSWTDINTGDPNKKTLKRNYLTLWLDHGITPNNGEYSYVLLPGFDPSELIAYAENSPVSILENNGNVQAIEHKGLRLVGANIWKEGVHSVGSVTVYKQASIMYRQTENLFEIAVADPTHENQGIIAVDVKLKGTVIIEADEGVSVDFSADIFRVSVDVKASRGKSYTARIKLM